MKLPAAITTTLECAGSRSFYEPRSPAQWEKGAVGTARFTGTRLSEVLKRPAQKPGSTLR
jgi:hypothetical protein